MSVMRGSASTIFAPRLAAFFIQVAATGWLAVGFEPITRISSACSTSLTWLLTRRRSPRLRAAPPRWRRGTGACSGRRCCCRSRCAPVSGTGRPLRCCPWPSRSRPATSGRCVSRSPLSLLAARSSASSQVASRNTSRHFAGIADFVRILRHAGLADQRASVRRCGWCA